MKYVILLIFAIIPISFVAGIILVLFHIEAGVYMMLSSIILLLFLFCSFFGKIPFFSSIGFILSLTLVGIFEHKDVLVLLFGSIGFVSMIVMIVSMAINVIKISKTKNLENKKNNPL